LINFVAKKDHKNCRIQLLLSFTN